LEGDCGYVLVCYIAIANCFAVWWLHSGWQWQCNTKEHPNATCFIFCAVRGRTAVGGGNVTEKNIPACAHERQTNRTATSHRLPFQANVMDLDFKIFDSERLRTEVEKRPALYD